VGYVYGEHKGTENHRETDGSPCTLRASACSVRLRLFPSPGCRLALFPAHLCLEQLVMLGLIRDRERTDHRLDQPPRNVLFRGTKRPRPRTFAEPRVVPGNLV